MDEPYEHTKSVKFEISLLLSRQKLWTALSKAKGISVERLIVVTAILMMGIATSQNTVFCLNIQVPFSESILNDIVVPKNLLPYSSLF